MQDFIKLRPLFMVFYGLNRGKINCHFATIVFHFADTVSQTQLVTSLTCTFSFQYRRSHADADPGTQRLVSSKRPPGADLPRGRHVTRGGGVSKTSVVPSTPTLGTVSLITILMFVAFVSSTIRGECSISHFISSFLKFTLSSFLPIGVSIHYSSILVGQK